MYSPKQTPQKKLQKSQTYLIVRSYIVGRTVKQKSDKEGNTECCNKIYYFNVFLRTIHSGVISFKSQQQNFNRRIIHS